MVQGLRPDAFLDIKLWRWHTSWLAQAHQFQGLTLLANQPTQPLEQDLQG